MGERHKSGKSVETNNHDIQAIKGFTNWLLAEGCLSIYPFSGLKTQNAKCDRHRVRRGFTDDEFQRLLDVTVSGPTHHGLTGIARAILYNLAVYTGMRHNELRSFTRSSFVLDDQKPYVLLEAKSAKNRKRFKFNLPAHLLDDLSKHLHGIQVNAPAFPMWKKKGASMIQMDLKAAAIPISDAQGRILDFHCLRNSLATMANKAGVPAFIIQKLMRHSNLDLTQHYTTIDEDPLEKAAGMLPKFFIKKSGLEMDHQMDQEWTDKNALRRTEIANNMPVSV